MLAPITRREVLGALPSEIEAVCKREVLDPTLRAALELAPELRAQAESLYNELTTQQRALVDMGSTARSWIISTPERDRHRSVILPEGWELEAYRANPVILFQHNYDALPIGLSNGAKLTSKKQLRSVGVLLPPSEDPEVARIERRLELGLLRSASVGAVPREVAFVEDDNGDWWIEYRKTELVEWSIVSIPSNRSSMVEAARMAQAEGMNADTARDFLSQVSRWGMEENGSEVGSVVDGAGSDPWAPFRPLLRNYK